VAARMVPERAKHAAAQPPAGWLQMWDYVFDVDAEDGAPPKKLALNRGENPYAVADRFLADEDLPASYRCCFAPLLLLPCPCYPAPAALQIPWSTWKGV
jgi:hypothetical protein